MRILSFPEGDTLVTKRLVVDSQKPAFKDYKWKDTGQQLIFSTRELSVAFDKEEMCIRDRSGLCSRRVCSEGSYCG